MTAVLLAMVLLTALGILVTTVPASTALPQPIDVALDFATFVPGETQTTSYPLTVPAAARFAEAGIVQTTGIADDVTWTFALCDDATAACRPVVEGADVARGHYTLRVSATLSTDVAGQGTVLGRVRLEQSDDLTASGFTSFQWMIVAAMAAVVVGGIVAAASTQHTARRSTDDSHDDTSDEARLTARTAT